MTTDREDAMNTRAGSSETERAITNGSNKVGAHVHTSQIDTPGRVSQGGVPVRTMWPLCVGMACLVIVLALGVSIMVYPSYPPFQGLDNTWLALMHPTTSGPAWMVANFFDLLGATPGLVIPVVIAGIITLFGRWRSALFMGVTYIVSQAVSSGLKLLVERPRPDDPLVEVSTYAFPSGHSSRIAVMVILVGLVLIPRQWRKFWWPVGIVLVLTMMWSRTYVHVHWLTDTIGGALTGTAGALIMWWIFMPLLRQEKWFQKTGSWITQSLVGPPYSPCQAANELSRCAPSPYRSCSGRGILVKNDRLIIVAQDALFQVGSQSPS